MKIVLRAAVSMLCSCLVLAAACGRKDSEPGTPAPAKAVVRIASSGQMGPDRLIGGITVTAVLPAGVTVKATPDTRNTSILVADQGVASASGAAGVAAVVFATIDSSGSVLIQVYDQNGFAAGEFVTITCDLAPGTAPAAESFRLEGFVVKDLNGADIAGLTPGLTVDLQ